MELKTLARTSSGVSWSTSTDGREGEEFSGLTYQAGRGTQQGWWGLNRTCLQGRAKVTPQPCRAQGTGGSSGDRPPLPGDPHGCTFDAEGKPQRDPHPPRDPWGAEENHGSQAWHHHHGRELGGWRSPHPRTQPPQTVTQAHQPHSSHLYGPQTLKPKTSNCPRLAAPKAARPPEGKAILLSGLQKPPTSPGKQGGYGQTFKHTWKQGTMRLSLQTGSRIEPAQAPGPGAITRENQHASCISRNKTQA